jgi:hypothetical protein
MTWIIQNNQLINDECINDGTKPCVGDSPYTMWRIDPNANGGKPYSPLMIGVAVLSQGGAFKDATYLKKIVIPESCKSIGAKAFAGTLLTSVTIASDCTYSETSFPNGCVVNFYPD